ncbi:hypothetical protein VOLCADRAFT_105974 [Volvox carteri f. nagariensis]|uniref:Uncharacterized protein n=1 Tax=Volvox carteri f. nagariensis TaxID=3068 RepID=D8U427_VOLCA|nr:uncharacterized protein VOLCADRAFT_105974 [Volvox carteri f. nagariensis]EFJ45426.1 hypothetical protein VOLCADRAFT_105974 [Volvox carteri f. nagariensis]|eukprot:XP_002953453.1 hypothetical protein VOLCADRAFT_105974 [Volvox carteri f. nagariensis]
MAFRRGAGRSNCQSPDALVQHPTLSGVCPLVQHPTLSGVCPLMPPVLAEWRILACAAQVVDGVDPLNRHAVHGLQASHHIPSPTPDNRTMLMCLSICRVKLGKQMGMRRAGSCRARGQRRLVKIQIELLVVLLVLVLVLVLLKLLRVMSLSEDIILGVGCWQLMRGEKATAVATARARGCGGGGGSSLREEERPRGMGKGGKALIGIGGAVQVRMGWMKGLRAARAHGKRTETRHDGHALKEKKRRNTNGDYDILQSLSDHRACAERRLIDTWVLEARKHGQRPHQVAQWIRRKAGTTIVIWRRLHDGTLGCSVPCVCCRQLLQHYGLRVSCVLEGGSWWDGRLDQPGAPLSKPTSGQRHKMNFGGGLETSPSQPATAVATAGDRERRRKVWCCLGLVDISDISNNYEHGQTIRRSTTPVVLVVVADPRRSAQQLLPPPPRPLPLPQFYMHFGKCGHNLQQQEFGLWSMTRPLSQQLGRHSLVFYLDTGNVFPVAPVFGRVEPPVFKIRQMHLAYFNKSGVMAWSPALDKTPYRETAPYYSVFVNGTRINTVRDLKDSGVLTPQTSVYSLKVILNDIVQPSTKLYRIEVVKSCALGVAASNLDAACAGVPDPATVFLKGEGYFAFSFWNVGQPLTVNGTYVRDHAWCPVQTGITVD